MSTRYPAFCKYPSGKCIQPKRRIEGRTAPCGMATRSSLHTKNREISPLQFPGTSRLGKLQWVLHSQINGKTIWVNVDKVATLANLPKPLVTSVSDDVVADVGNQTRRVFWWGDKESARFIIPVFDSPHQSAILKIAEQIKTALKDQGVDVAILRNPPRCTYTIALQAHARTGKGKSKGEPGIGHRKNRLPDRQSQRLRIGPEWICLWRRRCHSPGHPRSKCQRTWRLIWTTPD